MTFLVHLSYAVISFHLEIHYFLRFTFALSNIVAVGTWLFLAILAPSIIYIYIYIIICITYINVF